MVIRRTGCEEVASLAPWGLEWKDDGIAHCIGCCAVVVVVLVVVVSVFGWLVFRHFVSQFAWKLGFGIRFRLGVRRETIF